MADPHVIEITVAPKAKANWNKLVSASSALAVYDPSCEIVTDPASGLIVLKGTSVTQLDLLVTALKLATGVSIDLGSPQVAYRETVRRRVETDYTYKRQTGETRQFARVKIVVEPDAAGGFESKLPDGTVPYAFISSVAEGIETAMRSGILAGFPLVDVKVTLIDGAFHERDSSALAFEIAAGGAFREALRNDGSILLEPIMAVSILIPEDDIGSVTDDLQARLGTIQGQESHHGLAVIKCLMPFANTFGYDTQLRAITRGRGTFTMGFSHYAPVPPRPDDEGPAAPAVALRG